MFRRSGDEIEQRIARWEKTRDGLGWQATHGVVRVINQEINKLRHEKLKCARPLPGGRRASDPPQRADVLSPTLR